MRGSYGIAVTNSSTVQENFDGNFDLTYDISKLNNGSLLLRAFTKPTTFGLQPGMSSNLNQSFGVGIQYNKNFDNFREFLGLEQRVKKEKNSISTLGNNTKDTIPVYKVPKQEEKRIDSIRQNLKDSTKVSYQKATTIKPKPSRRGLVKIK